ncbi:MAG: DUF1489 domain-containing protein [Alphaproteobacteria bacterium]|nr:DUF1489 domain-containing protein [Alphaproteobacteria bacterium]
MPLHLKKLSVGSENIKTLTEWHQQVMARHGRIMHVTRSFPKRATEVLDGGSMYWIIKGWMCARQPITDLIEVERQDGKPACGIVLAPGLIPLVERRMRPFQGWRYLEADDAPADLPLGTDHDDIMPREMQEELRSLGLL